MLILYFKTGLVQLDESVNNQLIFVFDKKKKRIKQLRNIKHRRPE